MPQAEAARVPLPPGESRRFREPGSGDELFANHLRRHGPKYFSEGGGEPMRVVLAWMAARPSSTLYAYEITTAHGRRAVLVKVLSSRPDPQPLTGDPTKDRPRLMRGFDPRLRCRLEYEALAAVHDHFQGLKDPRFGAVRAYGALPAERALIMERVPHPSLRDLRIPRRQMGSRGWTEPEVFFRHAGEWLRMYHRLPRPRPHASRHTRRDDFLAFTLDVTSYLARTVGRAAFFRRVAASVERAGRAVLPDALPAGLSHGDYAMRNVLADPGGAVSVIDMNGRWRTSVYEDIGHFLADLDLSAIQILGRGRLLADRSRRYRHAFLEGYFGRKVPIEIVRLYEVQACLDRWAANVARLNRTKRLSRWAVRRLRVGLLSSHFRRVIEDHLRALPTQNRPSTRQETPRAIP